MSDLCASIEGVHNLFENTEGVSKEAAIEKILNIKYNGNERGQIKNTSPVVGSIEESKPIEGDGQSETGIDKKMRVTLC